MSVYKRPGAKTYVFDFWIRGSRFCGDTGCEEKRAAVADEKRRKDDARARANAAAKLNAPRTWGEASSRYYEEVGQHHKAIDLTLAALEWLMREIGRDTALTAIDDNLVARLVAKRRAQKRQVGRRKDRAKQRPVSAATVNRTVTEPLRKVLIRAQKVWKVSVGDIDWSQHMLAEPQERVREASEGEESAVMGHLDRGYDEAMQFAFDSGCRRMEVIGLKKTDVDFFNRQFVVTGKGGKQRIIPMGDKLHAQLWRLKDTPTEYVFTYVAKRTLKRGKRSIVRGEHYPLTDAGFRSAQRRAIAASGVPNFRPHDTRHTNATRTLRVSNLRVVQHLLGHADVSTTAKYAHAMVEDIRAALNAVSPEKKPTEKPDDRFQASE